MTPFYKDDEDLAKAFSIFVFGYLIWVVIGLLLHL